MPIDDSTCLSYCNFLKMHLLTFLNGLNREYAKIRKRALRCKEGLPTFASLVKELKEEESHSLLYGASVTDIARDSSALLTQATSARLLGQPPTSSSKAPTAPVTSKASGSADMVCSYCHRTGHTRDRSFKLHPKLLQKKKGQPRAMLSQSDPPAPAASSLAVTLEQLQVDLIRLSSQMSALQPSSSTAPTQSSGLCSFFGACTSIPSDTWYCGQMALHSPLVSDTTWVLD